MKHSGLFIFLFLLSFASFGQSSRLFFDQKTLGEIRLNLPTKNWVDALDSLRLYGDNVLAGDATIDGSKYAGAGIRFRGNTSYQMGMKRNPMSIKLNFTDKNLAHQGNVSIKLSSALRDPSMVREALFYEIARKYMPASQTSYVKLYINDEYIGVFVAVESVDDAFLTKHFNDADGAFFKASPDYAPKPDGGCKSNLHGSLEYESAVDCYKNNFESLKKENWKDLQELTRFLSTDKLRMEELLDVDHALWMLALDNVMVNLSSYLGQKSENFYLYQDANKHFHPILWDLNLAFGSFKNVNGNDLSLGELQKLDPLLHANNPLKPLSNTLLSDPFYRKLYLSHIRQIIEENFDNGFYEKRAQELQGLIVVAFSEDKNKTYTLDDFQNGLKSTVGKKSKIPGILELMTKRVRYLKSHAEISPLPPVFADLKVVGREKMSNLSISSFKITAKLDRFPKKVRVYYRFSKEQAWQTVWMNEDSNEGNFKIFSTSIDSKGDAMEYYLVAENQGAISVNPVNYMNKPFVVRLSELNK
jgi:CotH kinase protein